MPRKKASRVSNRSEAPAPDGENVVSQTERNLDPMSQLTRPTEATFAKPPGISTCSETVDQRHGKPPFPVDPACCPPKRKHSRGNGGRATCYSSMTFNLRSIERLLERPPACLATPTFLPARASLVPAGALRRHTHHRETKNYETKAKIPFAERLQPEHATRSFVLLPQPCDNLAHLCIAGS